MSENYLYDLGYDIGAYTGDICSYLTDGVWRLPNAAEFNASRSASGSSRPIFVLHGYRNENGQYTAGNGGREGMHWSGTPGPAIDHAYCLRGNISGQTFLEDNIRQRGFSVRCVKIIHP
jgi:hypothetical protein